MDWFLYDSNLCHEGVKDEDLHQRCIQNPVKHLTAEPLTIFAKSSILDVLQGSEYAIGHLSGQ